MKSMTGFGRAAGRAGGFEVTVEIKSVNSRYLDLTTHLPKQFSCLEERFKPFLQEKGISRGKADITLTAAGGPELQLAVDTAKASSYLAALRELQQNFSLPGEIDLMQVAQNKDIFSVQTQTFEPDALWKELLPILEDAVKDFIARREKEGKRLETDLLEKLENLKASRKKIGLLSGENAKTCLQKLAERIREVLAESGVAPDEGRLLTEAALAVDRMAIDEELVRLDSHFVGFTEIAGGEEAAGRKLDFLLQEMNREVNTVGSKCDDARIAREVVEMKCELEKIREQVQNIE